MKWTTETPTEAGWYWYRDAGTTPRVVEITVDGDSLSVWFIGNECELPPREQHGEWFGPLSPPT